MAAQDGGRSKAAKLVIDAPELLVFAILLSLVLAVWGRWSALALHRLAIAARLRASFRASAHAGAGLRECAALLRQVSGADVVLIVRGSDPRACRVHADGDLSRRDWHGQRMEPRLAGLLIGTGSEAALAGLLEAREVASLALATHGRAFGCVHLVWRGRHASAAARRRAAALVAEATPLIENIDLRERLRRTDAGAERRRIARDLHDGTVQPYIGLKLGLEALRRRVPRGEPFAAELDEMIRIAGEGIGQLRRYMGRLNIEAPAAGPQSLLRRLRRQVSRCSALYGIEASVIAERDFALAGPLCEEVMNIVGEGLANVRRHTSARKASVALRAVDGKLLLELANVAGPAAGALFRPRSISERARELGGSVSVARRASQTVVAVEVPL